MAVTESETLPEMGPSRLRLLDRGLAGRSAPLLAALIVLLVRLAYLAYGGLTYDDAYISLRYAENLAAGHGLLYNPGERVFGATTPLYVLLLAAFSMAGISAPLLGGKLLCAAADALTAGLWFAAIRRRTGGAFGSVVFTILFGLSPFLVDVTVSGMETSLVLLGITVAFLAAERRMWLGMAAAIGVTALIRLDTLLFGGILLAYAAWDGRRVPWREAAVVLGCLLPWVLFATVMYGSPIPNSIPAKLAAYNAHRPSIVPNLLYATSFVAPFRNGWREECFTAVVAPLFLLGCLHILRRDRDWWPVPVFFFVHWAFLVLSRTVLFRWYFAPGLLPFYVVAAVGSASLPMPAKDRRRATDDRPPSTTHQAPGYRAPSTDHRAPFPSVLAWGLVVLLTAHTAFWLCGEAVRARGLRRVEERTRRAIGLWLRENTPVGATVATEPIGYIGYFSRRRVLDEVGLVSPAMIPLLRQGDGWFGRAVRRFQPDYVVERIHFLARNDTINAAGLSMFATAEDRRWFETHYAPVRWYCENVTPFPVKSYSFIIFARRNTAKSSIRISNR